MKGHLAFVFPLPLMTYLFYDRFCGDYIGFSDALFLSSSFMLIFFLLVLELLNIIISNLYYYTISSKSNLTNYVNLFFLLTTVKVTSLRLTVSDRETRNSNCIYFQNP